MKEDSQPQHTAIAIDGPAASGKSTVARRLAEVLGCLYVNSGAIYRAVTWALLNKGVAAESPGAVTDALASLEIECGADGGVSTILIDGEDPGPFLNSEEVNRNVSAFSAIPALREVLVKKLVAYREIGDIVMEGRDIGSVVLPDSPFKFYIDASEEVRSARRRNQGLQDSITERDRHDSSRKASPLVIPEDAHVIDSSSMSVEEVVGEIVDVLREGGFAGGS